MKIKKKKGKKSALFCESENEHVYISKDHVEWVTQFNPTVSPDFSLLTAAFIDAENYETRLLRRRVEIPRIRRESLRIPEKNVTKKNERERQGKKSRRGGGKISRARLIGYFLSRRKPKAPRASTAETEKRKSRVALAPSRLNY